MSNDLTVIIQPETIVAEIVNETIVANIVTEEIVAEITNETIVAEITSEDIIVDIDTAIQYPMTASNVGDGEGEVYKNTVGTDLRFKSIKAGPNITVTDNTDDITISSTDTGEANTASNVGTAGVGIFKQKSGVDFQFKKVNAGSNKVAITDDNSNNEVDIDIVPGNISHSTLSGLSSDDHTQYHNDARANTWIGTKSIADLEDVTLTTPANNQLLTYDSGSSRWVNSSPSYISGVDWGEIGGTLSDQTDLQNALDAKQPLDSDLTALTGLSSTGILIRTGSGTATTRTITAGTGISISNGDGVSGNPTVTSTITQYTDEMARDAAGAAFQTSTDGALTWNISDPGDTYTPTVRTANASQNGLLSSTDWTTFNNKEAAITAGTTAQYWRGDKTWQDFGTAADARIALQKGASNGLATLGADSKIPTSQIPALAITDTFVVGSQVAMLALTAERGDVAVRTDENKSYILQGNDPTNLSDWQLLLTPTDSVLSVNGQTGIVVLTTSDITEGTNLYHTPARAQAAITGGASTIVTSNLTVDRALISNGSGKVAVSSVTSTELVYVSGVTSAIQTQLDAKQATGNYITALTGDGTASGPGSVAFTLATVNSNVGTFNNLTVNAKGLVTAASNVSYLTGNQTITLSGDTTGSGTTTITTTIANDAVTLAKMQNIATASVIGRNTAGTGDPEVLTTLPVGIQNSITHSNLTGLTSGDDHTQYALLAGRSGGQTLKGGTASGDDLTLVSTNHATKGSIFLGSAQTSAFDEVNNRLGIGITSPNTRLHVRGAAFTISAPASATSTINYGNDDYFANGTSSHKVRVYSAIYVNGLPVFSSGYAESTIVTDDGSFQSFNLTHDWPAVIGADFYRALIYSTDDNYGWNFDGYIDTTDTFVDDNGYNVTSGNTVTPIVAYDEAAIFDGNTYINGFLGIDTVTPLHDIHIDHVSGNAELYVTTTGIEANGVARINVEGNGSSNGRGHLTLSGSHNGFSGQTGDGSALIALEANNQATNPNRFTIAAQGNGSGFGLLKFDIANNGGGTAIDSPLSINQAGCIGIGTSGQTAQVHEIIGSSSRVGLLIQGAASQSGKYLQIQNSSGTQIDFIDSAGNLSIQRGSTAAASRIHVAQGTGGAAGTAFFQVDPGNLETTPRGGTMEFHANFFFTHYAGLRFAVGGTIKDFSTDAGNSHATNEIDLYSFTTIASTFRAAEDKVEATYAGIFVNSASTKRLRVYFKGNVIFDSGALTVTAAATWEIRVFMIAKTAGSSGVIRYSVTMTSSNTSATVLNNVGELTGQNLSGATGILKITGQAAGGAAAINDIVAKSGTIAFAAGFNA